MTNFAISVKKKNAILGKDWCAAACNTHRPAQGIYIQAGLKTVVPRLCVHVPSERNGAK